MSPRATSIFKWTGITLLVLILLLAFVIALIASFDWNRAKPWINRHVSDALGRPFAINGDLSVQWKSAPPSITGWRRWVPWPHIDARDITLANPDWVKETPQMVKVREVAFAVSPLALLHKQLIIPALRIDTPRVHLQRRSDGSNNWTFKHDDKQPSSWNYELQQLSIDNGAARLIDAIRKADIYATIESRKDGKQQDTGVTWTVSGTLDDDEVRGNGSAGKLLSLQQKGTHYPVQAELRVGKTRIHVDGTLINPQALAALDVQLKLSGISMDQLYPLTGITLPNTPPYSTEGHLTGTLNRHGGDWRYEHFKGKVGNSDIGGTIEFVGRAPRPLLKGNVVSHLLNFDDLAPLIGGDSNAHKIQRGARPVQPQDKVLPVEKFRTDRWKSIDADIRFTGNQIVRKKDLPINNLVTHLQMQDGVITLQPLDFGVAGGKLHSDITLDGSGSELRAKLKASARRFELNKLLPALPQMHASLGHINGDASLSATGDSVAALLGTSNGEVKALIDQGTVSKMLLEEMGLNVGNIILTKLFGDEQVQINCLASDFTVKNGVMTPRLFVFDTPDAALYVDGKIDLGSEKLDLTLHPETKSLRLLSLRSPLYVQGTFKHPDVSVDKKVLAAKAGGALVLGIAAPVATALLPLINAGHDKNNPCGALLAQARQKPVAPPPGKTATPAAR